MCNCRSAPMTSWCSDSYVRPYIRCPAGAARCAGAGHRCCPRRRSGFTGPASGTSRHCSAPDARLPSPARCQPALALGGQAREFGPGSNATGAASGWMGAGASNLSLAAWSRCSEASTMVRKRSKRASGATQACAAASGSDRSASVHSPGTNRLPPSGVQISSTSLPWQQACPVTGRGTPRSGCSRVVVTTLGGSSRQVVLRVLCRRTAEAGRHAPDQGRCRGHPRPRCLHPQRTLRGLLGMAHGVTAHCGRLTASWPVTARRSATEGHPA